MAVLPPRRDPASLKPSDEHATDGSTAERHLLEQAQGGNRSAAETLFHRYRSWLRRWARGRLPAWVRDGIDTSDVVHDALSRTFAHLDSLQSNRASALRAYLRHAVENRIHDQLRRARRRRDLSISQESVWASGGPVRRDRLVHDEAWRCYSDGLARLTIRDRRLIAGRLELGYSYRQLAFVEGLSSAEAARKAVGRALCRLIDILD